MTEKPCASCNEFLPLDAFRPVQNRSIHSRTSWCKPCEAKKARDRRDARALAEGREIPERASSPRDGDQYRLAKPIRLIPHGAPRPLCAGSADLFELEGPGGATAGQIRAAVTMCGACPFFNECAEGAEGTIGMVRAGKVYASNGVAHDPERYIQRQGGVVADALSTVREHSAAQLKLSVEDRDPECPLSRGNRRGYALGCRCKPCSGANSDYNKSKHLQRATA